MAAGYDSSAVVVEEVGDCDRDWLRGCGDWTAAGAADPGVPAPFDSSGRFSSAQGAYHEGPLAGGAGEEDEDEEVEDAGEAEAEAARHDEEGE